VRQTGGGSVIASSRHHKRSRCDQLKRSRTRRRIVTTARRRSRATCATLSGEPVQAVPDPCLQSGQFWRGSEWPSLSGGLAVVIVGVGLVMRCTGATPPTSGLRHPRWWRRRAPQGANPEAYNGRGSLCQRPFGAMRSAPKWRSRAIALDPNFALPWVKLALLQMRQAAFADAQMKSTRAAGRRSTALASSPTRWPHMRRASFLVRVEFRWADARAELDRMLPSGQRSAAAAACEATFAASPATSTSHHIQGRSSAAIR